MTSSRIGPFAACGVALVLCLLLQGCRGLGHGRGGATSGKVESDQRARARSEAAYRQGVSNLEAGRFEHARTHLAAAVEGNSQSVHAWIALGVAGFELEDHFGAARAFHRAAQLAPDRYEPHYNLGTVLEAVGRYPEAIKAYVRALECSPDQLEVIENLARTYVKSGREPEKARRLVEQAIAVEARPEWRMWLTLQSQRLDAQAKAPPPAASR
jgi:tetratricopeptide (TPR) repeat protein